MGLFLSGLMLLCGTIAASGFLVSKRPEIGGIVKKLESFQGSIGPMTFFWSLISLIYMFRIVSMISQLAEAASMASKYGADVGTSGGGLWTWWVSGLIACLLGIVLGFLLGYGALSKFFLSGKEELQEKVDAIRRKIAGIQMPLGLAGIVMAIWFIIATLIWIP
jgi:hypothetical protein